MPAKLKQAQGLPLKPPTTRDEAIRAAIHAARQLKAPVYLGPGGIFDPEWIAFASRDQFSVRDLRCWEITPRGKVRELAPRLVPAGEVAVGAWVFLTRPQKQQSCGARTLASLLRLPPRAGGWPGDFVP